MSNSDKFMLYFDPRGWAPEKRFSQFLGPPFVVDVPLSRGVSAVISHLEKYELLGALANDLTHLLDKDERELDELGHTPGTGGRKFAALAEAMLGELYSTLDGLRQVIYSVYRKINGVQNESTYKLFQRAAKSQYGEGFPSDLREVLAAAYASWFPRLRLLRSENTHGEIGGCHLSEGSIKYMHNGLKENGCALVIEDIVGYLNQLHLYIRSLVNWLFSTLYEKLEPIERVSFCGVFKEHIYERMVAPSANLSFADGRCLSVNWFSKEPELACPLRSSCGAYSRLVPLEEFRQIYSVYSSGRADGNRKSAVPARSPSERWTQRC
jgi:hypothetical protein